MDIAILGHFAYYRDVTLVSGIVYPIVCVWLVIFLLSQLQNIQTKEKLNRCISEMIHEVVHVI